MVVSKDSKRKRKESPPAQAAVIESSPEMPKRTKVQAQRKFAQGQNAPSSSYTATLAASSSSTTGGPSASSESREPPTEILPNKRPKTEDFLTFLCFRGTSALPAHLDFLNQGKGEEALKVTEKKTIKTPSKIVKKTPMKKGRKAKASKAIKTKAKAKARSVDEPVASTSAAAAAAAAKALLAAQTVTSTNSDKTVPPQTHANENSKYKKLVANDRSQKLGSTQEELKDTRSPGNNEVVEQKEQGNRRGRTVNEKSKIEEKTSKSPESKRRSNRTNVKEVRLLVESRENNKNDDDDYASANEASDQKAADFKDQEESSKKSKTPTQMSVHTSSTPTKEAESVTHSTASKGKKGKAFAGKKINAEHKDTEMAAAVLKEASKESEKSEPQHHNKAKQPMKRPRQKESPIFIPSPEPTGRMTRQRAFFEPVKVLPTDCAEQMSVEKNGNEEIETPPEDTTEIKEKSKKTNPEVAKRNGKNSELSKNSVAESKAEEKINSLNVFDFSSDDEQPLSKSIKLKKSPTSGSRKKISQAAKRKGKRMVPKKLQEISRDVVIEKKKDETEVIEEIKADKKTSNQTEPSGEKNKRSGKMTKKKQSATELSSQNEANTEVQEEAGNDAPTPPLVKKTSSNVRQQRKTNKPKSDITTSNGTAPNEKSLSGSPVRSQRPSRKTKEAAAIYMGIIGQKLQQNEDEDDDMSLNSFPDLPNVKEMEKMEIELKKNATSTTPPTTAKSPTKINAVAELEKQVGGRRGRPPKQGRPPPSQPPTTQPPAKREMEGMLVKKGALTKNISSSFQSDKDKDKQPDLQDPNKDDSEDEDFLLNEEVNETKRKLEKSFSDSDDEPLAVKVNLKSSDKDLDNDSRKSDYDQPCNVSITLTTPPAGGKQSAPSSATLVNAVSTKISTSTTVPQNVTASQTASLKTTDKKSSIPNSKSINMPAGYNLPSTTQNSNAFISKMEHKLISPNLASSYLPPASPHYHARPSPHSTIQAAKSPTQPPPPSTMMTHISPPPPPPQSPMKYQTPPTTYPPPIEAYPSPKINPNFLTPKFDRSVLPRANNFPSPSPIKFDLSSTTPKTGGIQNCTLSPKTVPTLQTLPGGANTGQAHPSNPTTSAAAAAAVASTAANASSSDPLKDEIGSILAANLMPSKEESGKIFGIASVSLAQSSGPDNTKCTLGKCGSIHKPVLGPVVPTEGYIGDQLSSKERRKAKVNMTHEQIQKWLIECSSNPDEIQDDMDDDYDDNLRPNLFATTPPPTRDDKESTSFSSSSKATRDLGKSESAWSGKGPSLKAIPVVASTSTKEDQTKNDYAVMQHPQTSTAGNETPQLGNVMTKGTAASKQHSNNVDNKPSKEKLAEKKFDKKSRDEKLSKETNKEKEGKQTKADKEKEHAVASVNTKMAAAGKQSSATVQTTSSQDASTSAVSKPNRKKNTAASITVPSVREDKLIPQKSATSHTSNTAQKRTPVYNQKAAQKHIELKETTTTSHKKKSPFSYNFGAFSVENEKSIYSFDKDDDEEGASASKPLTKPIFRRQSRRDSQPDDIGSSTPTLTPTPRSPLKKRSAASVVPTEKAPKDAANASQSSSVSLTLSPAENCKLVKVSLEAEQQTPVTSKAKSAKLKSKLNTPSKPAAEAAPDSDSDGHTFYIPLQGTGTGGSAEGGIQGVAVKLGREGPEGPNQKVIMHATLVTKAQMGQNSKPLPDSMNASEIVKNLLISTGSSTAEVTKKSTCTSAAVASTSAAAAVNSASNSLKSVPIGTVQPRFKGTADPAAGTTTTTTAQPSTSAGGSGLVRVNSNSSLFSGSAKSRHGAGGPTANSGSKKLKDDTPIKMSNNTAFPRHDDPTQMVEAPIFRPTEKEFSDPIDFIERITPIAARFGICKIIPPPIFKPECRISDEMRFTAYNQYVHKMLHRWGPSAKELSAIKKYLATQSIVMNHPPWIGGMEVDLPRLYHTVQELGGLKEVIEKKKWARVAEEMCIPKLAQDRVTKLDDIYCKYLLPYDTLSPTERQKLFDEVEADWAKREARARRNADRFVNTESVSNEEDDVSSDDDEESEEEVDGVSMECIVKGRSMPLSQFYRIARNTMTLWFKNTEPTVNEVEAEFWRHVAVRDSHVCVHSGSIDSSGWGYGFPTPGPKGKGSNYARHPWNLKVLTNNSGSVLRSLGPVMGVTVPTLHVGMLFSACCWYRDPHGLSWIEYLHTGASKLWYGIPDDQSANFRSALTSLIPTHCQNKTIWLPCDTVMVPPHMLTDRGVSLCRIEQKPGEFIVVFPRAYTSSVATGYVVSESVYFATNSWLDLAKHDFRDIHDSCEPAMFSLEQLLFALGSDQRVASDTLQQMLPMLNEVYEKETAAREQLKAAGVTSTEKVPNEKGSKSKKQHAVKSIESECDLCRANLYISMVRTDEGNVYCLQHALKNLNNGNIQAKQCKLIFAYNIEDVDNLIKNLNDKIQQKRIGNSNKKGK